MCICVLLWVGVCMSVQVPRETRCSRTPWSWSYKRLWITWCGWWDRTQVLCVIGMHSCLLSHLPKLLPFRTRKVTSLPPSSCCPEAIILSLLGQFFICSTHVRWPPHSSVLSISFHSGKWGLSSSSPVYPLCTPFLWAPLFCHRMLWLWINVQSLHHD